MYMFSVRTEIYVLNITYDTELSFLLKLRTIFQGWGYSTIYSLELSFTHMNMVLVIVLDGFYLFEGRAVWAGVQG